MNRRIPIVITLFFTIISFGLMKANLAFFSERINNIQDNFKCNINKNITFLNANNSICINYSSFVIDMGAFTKTFNENDSFYYQYELAEDFIYPIYASKVVMHVKLCRGVSKYQKKITCTVQKGSIKV